MDTTVLAPPCGCGHEAAEHDVIAARFCRATDAGHLTRSCICHKVPGVVRGLATR